MQVTQFEIRLSQNQVDAQERKLGVRTVEIPGYNCYYYSQYNLLARLSSSFFQIYFIHQDKVDEDKAITQQLMDEFGTPEKVLFFDNHIVIYKDSHFIKINVGNFNQRQIFYVLLPQGIIKYQQINGKCFMIMIREEESLRIYSLRNFKKSHTYQNSRRIKSIQYHKHIVQAFTDRHLYYFNTKMTKQIRRQHYYYIKGLPIFNSNYLLDPSIGIEDQKFICLDIIDIQSMKKKGTMNRIDGYHRCIFIKEFNVIAVLLKSRIDLYDFTTLKCISREYIKNTHKRVLVMKYDEYNGLTILFL